MTIRKQWLLILMLIAIFSVSVNAFVLSSLTDRYFVDYMREDYDKHINQIVEYSKRALTEANYSRNQMAIELETQLDDPITRIKLYDEDGRLIVDVSNNNQMMRGMSNNGMMGRMMGTQLEETDYAEIKDANRVIGQLNITRYSSVENSAATQLFKASLISNSLYSIIIVLIFAVIIGIFVSRRMSKDLINTADMAQNIDLGSRTNIELAKVKEIRIIQQSLESLESRLRLKQKSRKTLVDELVHQTRTPLTILKTHLEGFEDGLIEMTPEQIRVCENQIENITSIISNMSGMIDADKDYEELNIEEFEFSALIKQIISGLKIQFEKKKVEFILTGNQKVLLKSDKYKLSQAIYNILTNAYKYTEANGKVAVHYEVISEKLHVRIEDTGIGISDKEITKIFDAYYRSTKGSDSRGEGIGLYVAKENISRLNGVIDVESKPQKGSKFTIILPLSQDTEK